MHRRTCCARACAEAGLSVIVVDRGAVASGTTGGGEGNILVSDKEPGPELDLALLSRDLWAQMAGALGDAFELDPKGGLVVAARSETYEHLLRFADEQRSCGVIAETVAAPLEQAALGLRKQLLIELFDNRRGQFV